MLLFRNRTFEIEVLYVEVLTIEAFTIQL